MKKNKKKYFSLRNKIMNSDLKMNSEKKKETNIFRYEINYFFFQSMNSDYRKIEKLKKKIYIYIYFFYIYYPLKNLYPKKKNMIDYF